MAKDVYTFDTIQEAPFPNEPEVLPAQQQVTPGTLGMVATKPGSFPTKRIAHELLSTALNTRSKKILQEFDLADSGGFKIGDYKSGVSGDLRITPNGLTARDKAGLTTFAIDGEDGSAVFAGQIRAGSTIVSNTIVTEEASNGNGRTVYYNNGLPAIIIGDGS